MRAMLRVCVLAFFVCVPARAQLIDTTIKSAPPKRTNSTTATFLFESSFPQSRFRCSLDDAQFSICSNPITFTSLTEGHHSIQVRAVSPEGVEDPSPATYSWEVDNTAPQVIITEGPEEGDTTASDVTFEFTADEPSTFTCKLDSASNPCTSPVEFNGLKDGPHTMTIVAEDSCGNVDQSPPVIQWFVDTTPPTVFAPNPVTVMETTVVGGLHGATAAQSPRLFDFLNGANAIDATSVHPLPPRAPDGSSIGEHTLLRVGVTPITFGFADAAGNIGMATSSVTVWRLGSLIVPDGAVSAIDLLITARAAAGLIKPGQPPFLAPEEAADLNHDGVVDDRDVEALLSMVVEDFDTTGVPSPILRHGETNGSSLPIIVDVEGVRIDGRPVVLGAVVVVVAFDPRLTEVISVKEGVRPTDLNKANERGVLIAAAVNRDGFTSSVIHLTNVKFRDKAKGPRGSVRVSLGSAAGIDSTGRIVVLP